MEPSGWRPGGSGEMRLISANAMQLWMRTQPAPRPRTFYRAYLCTTLDGESRWACSPITHESRSHVLDASRSVPASTNERDNIVHCGQAHFRYTPQIQEQWHPPMFVQHRIRRKNASHASQSPSHKRNQRRPFPLSDEQNNEPPVSANDPCGGDKRNDRQQVPEHRRRPYGQNVPLVWKLLNVP
jgi:hypothetical protein